MNLLKAVKVIQVMNPVAAGATVQTSSAVDREGYDGCMFVASFGALSANQVTSIEGHQCDTTGGSYAALLGTLVGPMADGDSNNCLILDIYKPREQFLKCVVNRATGNAVINCVLAILYNAAVRPVALDASIAFAEVHASPAEGTA
jgi:hypothetical protein